LSAEPPDGFRGTKEAVVDWLIAELQGVGEPVHLVGHAWGALFATRHASVRPDRVKTWAVANGPLDADYGWHQLAKIWQTTGEASNG
jgi:pimeloyl-ACP methyl ester carboxylesterase